MRIKQVGFTLVELLVGMAISSIAIAGIYATYAVVKHQYERTDAKINLHNSGRAALQILSRDVRMAGYEHRNDQGVLVYGPIGQQPLTIASSGKEITVIYDYELPRSKTTIERRKVTYKAESFSNNKGARYQLNRTVEVMQPSYKKSQGLFADYVDDIAFTKTGDVVDIEILMRSKDEQVGSRKFTPKSYFYTGTTKTDGYEREVFATSVLPRNIQ